MLKYLRRRSSLAFISTIVVGVAAAMTAISLASISLASTNCASASKPVLFGNVISARGSETCSGKDALTVLVSAHRSGDSTDIVAKGSTGKSALTVHGPACFSRGLWYTTTLVTVVSTGRTHVDSSPALRYYCTSSRSQPLRVTNADE